MVKPARDYAGICRAHQARVLSGEVPASPNYRASAALQVQRMAAPPEGYVCSDEAGNRALHLIEQHHWGRGTVRGKKVLLGDWQVALLFPLFALIDATTALRLYTSTSWWLSKGAGKSPLAALVTLEEMEQDKTGGEFYSFASNQEQAGYVFTHAAEMLKKSPAITKKFDLVVEASRIRGVNDPRKFKAQPSKDGSIEGAAPRVAVMDEVHLQVDDGLYQNVHTACNKVEGSLLLGISTAGVDAGPEVCGMRLYNRALAIITGKVDAPREYPFIIDADPKLDPWSREALEQACPNLGISQSLGNLLAEQKKAKETPSEQADFRIKHLNQWVQAARAFIDIAAWRKLARPEITIEATLDDPEWEGAAWFCGIDLARTRDLSAAPIVAARMRPGATPEADQVRSYRVFTKGLAWLPEKSKTLEQTPDLKLWAADGWLQLTPGPRFNPAVLKAEVLPLVQNLPNVEVCFDDWCAAELEESFAEVGLTVVPVRQGARTQSEPMKELEGAILDSALEHDDSPVADWCMGNLTSKADRNDNVAPDKENAFAKIDVAVAIINAFVRASVATLEPYVPPEQRKPSAPVSRVIRIPRRT